MTDPYGLTSYQARTRGSLLLDAARERVVEAASRVTDQMNRYQLVELSSNRAVFSARMNWKTWGLRITLLLTQDDSGRTTIDALSEPRLGTTLFDYGQGKKDLHRILNFIEQEVKKPRTSQV
ncbi:hypothetical protein V6S67_16755 [Arthrobacter sp. Soc17.1.1.1]|uniref:hypothetical protein n=1 Tax=Arthrobacter sp. Soc17.1.1.1 TaxID=3121277 RepID=UPI002FE4BB7A